MRLARINEAIKDSVEVHWMCSAQVQNILSHCSLLIDLPKHNNRLSPHSIWAYARIRRYKWSTHTSCRLKIQPATTLPRCGDTRIDQKGSQPLLTSKRLEKLQHAAELNALFIWYEMNANRPYSTISLRAAQKSERLVSNYLVEISSKIRHPRKYHYMRESVEITCTAN